MINNEQYQPLNSAQTQPPGITSNIPGWIKTTILGIIFLGLFLCFCIAATVVGVILIKKVLPSTPPLGGGGLIVYAVPTKENSNDLYIYNVETKEETRLTNMPNSYKYGYSFSPDGKHLVFTSNFQPPNSWIYVIDVDGSHLKPLIEDKLSGNWFPDWSPNGDKIAFASDRYGEFNLFTMNSDGTDITRLTNYDSSAPNWSPDGKQIAFQVKKDDDYEIYVMNADGTSKKQLTQNPAKDMAPVWSPDGKKIAFYTERDGNGEIYLMDADGKNQTNLTMNPANDSSYSWSPDGKNLVFESKRSGSYEIYIINIETHEISTLPVHKDASAPIWSRKLPMP